MDKQELEEQADRVEAALNEYHAPARVTGGNVTPRWIQFVVQPAPGVMVDRVVQLANEISRALGATSARATCQGDVVRLDVPRSDPQPIQLMHLIKRLPHQIPATTAVLGIADDGAPLLVRLPSSDVRHVLIAADHLSIQTMLRTMLTSLAVLNKPRELRIVQFDFNFDAPNMLEMSLTDLVHLVEQREASHFANPRIVMVLDLDRAAREDVEVLLTRGPTSGVYLVGYTTRIVTDSRWQIVIRAVNAEQDEYTVQTVVEQDMRFTAAVISREEMDDLFKVDRLLADVNV